MIRNMDIEHYKLGQVEPPPEPEPNNPEQPDDTDEESKSAR